MEGVACIVCMTRLGEDMLVIKVNLILTSSYLYVRTSELFTVEEEDSEVMWQDTTSTSK